jgi:hypothetical protein
VKVDVDNRMAFGKKMFGWDMAGTGDLLVQVYPTKRMKRRAFDQKKTIPVSA